MSDPPKPPPIQFLDEPPAPPAPPPAPPAPPPVAATEAESPVGSATAEKVRADRLDERGSPEPPALEAQMSDPESSSGVAWVWSLIKSVAEWVVGLACLVAGLAVLAAVPVLQVLSFGYLLEVSGRIARERRLRSGFIGVRKAARVGFLLLHSWLMFLPLRLLSDVWHDAVLIDPQGTAAQQLGVAQLLLTIATVGHVLSAWYCGGRASSFYWPVLAPWRLAQTLRGRIRWSDWFPPVRILADLREGGVYQRSRDGVWQFFVGLRLPYYFRLGALGLLGAVIWLALPVLLLAGAAALPQGLAVLSGLTGGLLLAVVASRLPFMEANFAASGRWDHLMSRRLAGKQFARAPLAFWLALLLCLALAIPLHLIQAAPPILPELAWTLNLLFVVLLLPARFAVGWAVSRAEKREDPRFILSRILSRLGAAPLVLFYALVVYLSQFINYYGSWRLLEQPAFMLPAPFWLIG